MPCLLPASAPVKGQWHQWVAAMVLSIHAFVMYQGQTCLSSLSQHCVADAVVASRLFNDRHNLRSKKQMLWIWVPCMSCCSNSYCTVRSLVVDVTYRPHQGHVGETCKQCCVFDAFSHHLRCHVPDPLEVLLGGVRIMNCAVVILSRNPYCMC